MTYYICILDFEATCWKNGINKENMEIIEFPSILYKITNNKIEHIDKFHKYVKPLINPILSDFCINLTKIKQDIIDKSDTFNFVYKKHIEWLKEYVKDEKLIFITCGKWDFLTMLPRELKNKNIELDNMYKYYVNIAFEFKKKYKIKINKMNDMLDYFNLEIFGIEHSGIDDTIDISNIYVKMFEDGFTLDDMTLNNIVS